MWYQSFPYIVKICSSLFREGGLHLYVCSNYLSCSLMILGLRCFRKNSFKIILVVCSGQHRIRKVSSHRVLGFSPIRKGDSLKKFKYHNSYFIFISYKLYRYISILYNTYKCICQWRSVSWTVPWEGLEGWGSKSLIILQAK